MGPKLPKWTCLRSLPSIKKSEDFVYILDSCDSFD